MIPPDLQPLTGEVMTYSTSNQSENARLNKAANGFGGVGTYEKCSKSVQSTCLKQPHQHQQLLQKAWEWKETGIRAILLSLHLYYKNWGNGQTVHYILQEISLPFGWEMGSTLQHYSVLAALPNFFSLLRSAIQCICGACSSHGQAIKSPSAVDLVCNEAQLHWNCTVERRENTRIYGPESGDV